MPRAVRFDHYGPVDVLDVMDVDRPTTEPGRVLVEVVASSINPGEIMIREGAMHEQAPADFPSGQGSDLAGRVAEVGEGVTAWSVGDEVLGWSDERAAPAEFVSVPADQLTRRPPDVPWEQAAALYVAGCTAYGMVDAAASGAGDTVVVAGAAGGVGSIACQLLVRAGARVLGVAGPDNDEYLVSIGVEPVNYADDMADFTARLRAVAPDGIDALLDAYGGGYVVAALDVGVPSDRVVTIIDFDAAGKHDAKVVFGYQIASPAVLGELADLIASGDLAIPIAATYPLEQVRDAYTRLADRHTRGKIVLTL